MRPAAFAVPLSAGALTAVALGVYASVHEPTGRGLVWVASDSVEEVKLTLSAIVAVLFVLRLVTHRPLLGVLAFLISIPVAFHCLWALGFRHDDEWVLVHSILGCVAYGAVVTHVLSDLKPRSNWVAGVAAGSALVMLFTLEGATATPTVRAGPDTAGVDIFEARCANCHGDAGQGGVGPSLVDVANRFPDAATQELLVASGRGAMPAFGALLNEAEIAAVVRYTRAGFD